jgi:hypothetical protein
MIDGAYLPQNVPVPDNFFPGEKYGVIGVIHMSGLTSRSIDFNDGEVFSRPELVPAIKSNVKSAEVKTFYPPANRIDRICEFFIDQITCINKFCSSCMIAVGDKDFLLSLLQYSLQFVTISFFKTES